MTGRVGVAIGAGGVGFVLLFVVIGLGTDAWAPRSSRGAAPGTASGPNILLITIDALRADHVGLYGYKRPTTPRIDAYFGAGRVYEVAYSPTATTTPSIVSMLTGLHPPEHGVRLLCQRLSPEVVTVVDRIRRAGYQTAAVVSNAVLADSASGLGGRFEYYDDDVDEPEPFRVEMFERNAARTTDAVLRWLVEHRSADRPHFLWVHYIDPHGPYRAPADKPVEFNHAQAVPIDPLRVPIYARERGVTDGLEYVDRYDEEIAYTDREVGRLLSAYEELGLLDGSAVILTADHGESMMEHEHWFQHQMTVYEEMVRIPLAIRYAGVEPGWVKQPVSLVDVAPTVLALASLPASSVGVNLLGVIPTRYVQCEGRAEGGGLWRGLVRDGRKTAVRHGMSNVVREAWAFDLVADPGELNPLSVTAADDTYSLLSDLVQRDPDPGGVPKQYAEGELPAPNVAPAFDERMRARLKSLGYVGG
jgi:arylsulfatase A-like enzyme